MLRGAQGYAKDKPGARRDAHGRTASPLTENLDFGGSDSSRFSIVRDGIPRSIGISQKLRLRDS